MRADEAGLVGEVGDGLHQRGRGRVAADVEHEDLVVVQAAGPQVTAVVGEAAVVRLAAPAHAEHMHDLAVIRGLRIHIHGDELVRLVTHALHPERPHVDIVFLALDQGAEVGRITGFVGGNVRRDEQ